jgi:hypothetical protein
MATPHVAGLAALTWSARPDLTSVQVAEVITATAADANEHTWPGWDEYAGWGRIEASGAVSAALSLPIGEYGVEIMPSTAAMTATMGTLTTYTLTVRNTGNISDTYLVEMDGNAWETTSSADLIGPIDVDAVDALEITVAVPITASDGVTDTVDVVVTSVGDARESAISRLTTTAIEKTCYLPIIYHNR